MCMQLWRLRRSEDHLNKLALFFHHVVLGIKVRSLGLALSHLLSKPSPQQDFQSTNSQSFIIAELIFYFPKPFKILDFFSLLLKSNVDIENDFKYLNLKSFLRCYIEILSK